MVTGVTCGVILDIGLTVRTEDAFSEYVFGDMPKASTLSAHLSPGIVTVLLWSRHWLGDTETASTLSRHQGTSVEDGYHTTRDIGSKRTAKWKRTGPTSSLTQA